jgi:predicted nuclease of predicted toxin-antitoxin system
MKVYADEGLFARWHDLGEKITAVKKVVAFNGEMNAREIYILNAELMGYQRKLKELTEDTESWLLQDEE